MRISSEKVKFELIVLVIDQVFPTGARKAALEQKKKEAAKKNGQANKGREDAKVTKYL